MIEIKFEGVDYTQFDRKGIRSAMGKGARLVAAQIKKLINRRGGGGRTYSRRGQSYTSSAPGQPPARLSGNLVTSVHGRPSKRGYALVVSAVAPHARLLELGRSGAAARPYFEPTFADQAGAIEGFLREAVDKGITVIAGGPGKPPNKVEIN